MIKEVPITHNAFFYGNIRYYKSLWSVHALSANCNFCFYFSFFVKFVLWSNLTTPTLVNWLLL